MENQHSKHLFILCLATLCISTSAPLAKYIDLTPPVIIWWRCSIATIFLYIYCKYKKASLKIQSRKDVTTFIIGALFLGIHWVTYYYALKLSNVAIGMLSMYTFPVISALLEPFFIKIKLDPIHIVLGIVVLLGVYVLAPDFNLQNSDLKGVILGVISAIFYALRLLLLKQHIVKYDGTMLMFYQVLILTIVMFPVLILMDTSGTQSQFSYLLILALVSTALGHTLMVKSIQYFAVSTASIISSAQPIYGIIIAYFVLNEVPSWNTFFGGLLILSTVIIEAKRSKSKHNKG